MPKRQGEYATMAEEPLSAEVLQRLSEEAHAGGHVLSAYLNTSPTRAAGLGHLLAYRDACKQLRQELPGAERELFESAAGEAEAYIAGSAIAGRPGLALFATGRQGEVRGVSLPTPPLDAVHWDERPYLEPLQAMLDDGERIAVALVDQERARLFTVFLGAIETQLTITDEVPGKQRTGGWFALAQTRYERHRVDHVLRHLKKTTAALSSLLRTRPFDRLLLSGPDEALSLLNHHLPAPLRARLAGTLNLELFAPDAAVLDAALRAGESIERAEELASVNELVNAATTPFVVFGVEETLAAVCAGRAHRLFVAHSLRLDGGECQDCGSLAHQDAGSCPVCNGPLAACADVGERVIERALAKGARVEVVSGDAERRLFEFGGLGAWTRYGAVERKA